MRDLQPVCSLVPFSVEAMIKILWTSIKTWRSKPYIIINGHYFSTNVGMDDSERIVDFTWQEVDSDGYIIVTTADAVRHAFPLNGIFQFIWKDPDEQISELEGHR